MTISPEVTWTAPGATATDQGGDSLTVTSNETFPAGKIVITYDDTDTFNNVAGQITRTVKVVGVIDFDPDSNDKLDQLTWTDGWDLQTSTGLAEWTDVPNA